MQDKINHSIDNHRDTVTTAPLFHEKLSQYMATGCDERIYLDKNGLTRYGINPLEYTERVNRGSCTCGSLNDDNVLSMNALLEVNLEQTANYEQLLAEQTAELKAVLNHLGEDKFDIFYAPSGTDLVYLPIVFANILYPNRPILNLLSCPEELGSGTLLATRGEYHADFNQFEEPMPKGQKIDPHFDIKVLYLDARGMDGKIINHEAYIEEQIARHANHVIIGSLVYGSKSGIQDNLDMIDRIGQNDIIWNVDLCQFRHDKSTIHRILDKNGCVMITGSKFYQAPPFCGAMLVNKERMAELAKGNYQILERFKAIFSGYDFPASLQAKTKLPLRKNIGLRLRWACFLNEHKKFIALSDDSINTTIDRWNAVIKEELATAEEFELMPDQARTNRSIISFRIKKDGRFLNHASLKKLYKQLVGDHYRDRYPFDRIFTGQPVAYGDKSFLRLAIGSMNIRKFYANDEKEFKDDRLLIQIIKEKIQAFEIVD